MTNADFLARLEARLLDLTPTTTISGMGPIPGVPITRTIHDYARVLCCAGRDAFQRLYDAVETKQIGDHRPATTTVPKCQADAILLIAGVRVLLDLEVPSHEVVITVRSPEYRLSLRDVESCPCP